jgi:RNA polymerase sigma factor (sigma-70 family)
MFEARSVNGAIATFPVTDWATIFAAGSSDENAHLARARLCKRYWFPVYAFVRRTWPTKSLEDALDVTQEFFAQRLEAEDIQHARPELGRFRTWVMSRISNLLRNDWHFQHARKRDPRKILDLEAAPAEERFRLEPRTTIDPLRLLERDLACAVLESALARVEDEYAARGDAAFFLRARHLLVPGEGEATYTELERRWGLRANTLHVRVHSMRQRLRRLIELELEADAENAEGGPDDGVSWLLSAVDLAEPPEARVLAPEPEKKRQVDENDSAEKRACQKPQATPNLSC